MRTQWDILWKTVKKVFSIWFTTSWGNLRVILGIILIIITLCGPPCVSRSNISWGRIVKILWIFASHLFKADPSAEDNNSYICHAVLWHHSKLKKKFQEFQNFFLSATFQQVVSDLRTRFFPSTSFFERLDNRPEYLLSRSSRIFLHKAKNDFEVTLKKVVYMRIFCQAMICPSGTHSL